MTFGPIVEKIAYLPEEYLPTLDKFVDELVAKADKEHDDELDRAIAETRKAISEGKSFVMTPEEHIRWVENVCS